MTDKRIEFAMAFDKPIAIVEGRISNHDPTKDPLPKKNLEFLIGILKGEKQNILIQDVEANQGQLVVPIKEVIDWGEPDGSDLRNSIYEIQVFYEQNF